MAGRVAGKVEPRVREAAPHTPGDGNVGRWAGLLASGSFYSRAFPLGPPSASKLVDDGDRAVASSGFVPGYSGGGRAGVAPASLFDPHERVTAAHCLSKKPPGGRLSNQTTRHTRVALVTLPYW